LRHGAHRMGHILGKTPSRARSCAHDPHPARSPRVIVRSARYRLPRLRAIELRPSSYAALIPASAQVANNPKPFAEHNTANQSTTVRPIGSAANRLPQRQRFHVRLDSGPDAPDFALDGRNVSAERAAARRRNDPMNPPNLVRRRRVTAACRNRAPSRCGSTNHHACSSRLPRRPSKSQTSFLPCRGGCSINRPSRFHWSLLPSFFVRLPDCFGWTSFLPWTACVARGLATPRQSCCFLDCASEAASHRWPDAASARPVCSILVNQLPELLDAASSKPLPQRRFGTMRSLYFGMIAFPRDQSGRWT